VGGKIRGQEMKGKRRQSEKDQKWMEKTRRRKSQGRTRHARAGGWVKVGGTRADQDPC
jgi:hypothetical protein